MRIFPGLFGWRRLAALGFLFVVLGCDAAVGQSMSSGGSTAAENAAGSISGIVLDQQGAAIPQAQLRVEHEGSEPRFAVADEQGRFSISGLTPGSYAVEAEAMGFRTERTANIQVGANAQAKITLTLPIDVQEQQVEVSGNDVDSSPENNGGAIVMKGAQLDALSNDQTEMQQQLEAIAGTDPEAGSQIYVDGFSGGKMPPKSSIREIRINSNPYSAQYDQLGWGRIEIFTKPGTDKLHGDYWMEGNDSALNSLSPFVKSQPAYYSYQFDGDLNGPISKIASYFTSIYDQRSIADSVVNAAVLDSSLNQVQFTQAISTPVSNLSFSPRVDLQLGKTQTLSLRYELQRTTATNGGVGQFALASQAFNSTMTEQVLQFSDTQAYGAKITNETRFQYIRDRNNQLSLSNAPTIAVQGAFTGGGNNLGASRDNSDHYELQDYMQIAAGKHDLNVGARLRDTRDANYSTANFNGQYTFATLNAYQITERGIRDGLSAAAIRAAGGGASQFTQTEGDPRVVVNLFDAGLYAEDNWKVKPDITLSYGMRFESQTDIHDHADFGPRLGLSWAISGGKNKPPRAVIRAGGGWFYTRFASANVLVAKRQNGVTESAFVVNSPDFYPETCTTNTQLCGGTAATSPTIYQLSPTLRAPYTAIGGIGVDKPLGKYASISANYLYSRGEHLFLTRNINAPLPGTYDPSDPTSGVRPLGNDENVFEYDSDGASARHRLVMNGNVHTKHVNLFGFYMLSKVDSNTSGVSTFPSNSYDLHEDYGRASYDIRDRLFMGGHLTLWKKIGLNPFIIAQSSQPFDITVGQDLNGDTQFNDRPAFATDLSRASVYKTKYGNFDTEPIAGQRIIPINYGKGPGLFLANLRLNKEFSFGPVIPDEPGPDAAKAADADKKAEPAKDAKAETKTETKTGDKGPAKPAPKPVKKEIQRKYLLGLGVSSMNILNHPNYGAPIGVLGSPLFGTSTSLTSVFGSGQADRTVNLETFFRF